MALEVARVLDTDEVSAGIADLTAAHHDVASTRRVDLAGRHLQRSRQQAVPGVEDRPDGAGGQRKAHVESARATPARIGDER